MIFPFLSTVHTALLHRDHLNGEERIRRDKAQGNSRSQVLSGQKQTPDSAESYVDFSHLRFSFIYLHHIQVALPMCISMEKWNNVVGGLQTRG